MKKRKTASGLMLTGSFQELWRTDTETVPLTRIDGEVPEAT